MADFDPQSLLSMPLSDVKAPVSLPTGAYIGVVAKREFVKGAEKDGKPGNTGVKFFINPAEAMPDVDADQLSQSLDGKKLEEKEQNTTFWITPDALYRLKEFGEHCGISEGEAANPAELIEMCIGKKVGFILGTSPNKKEPSKPYINIDRTFVVPE